ncbi:hypothetical protein BU15DRAFT_77747 [Melanogaster broomeanus]|nr:hypothetical protein BU15DRAFT_77747 [Melanogaster broomeanus]
MKEKCEWPEVDVSGARKGKAREVLTLLHQGKKKKWAHKVKACNDDDEVEIVGGKRSRASPSQISLDWLVYAIKEMSNWLGKAQVHRKSMYAHRKLMLVSRKARRAFKVFMDEATICGMLEESASESEEEEVDEEEIEEEIAKLQEDVAENPMSAPKV